MVASEKSQILPNSSPSLRQQKSELAIPTITYFTADADLGNLAAFGAVLQDIF